MVLFFINISSLFSFFPPGAPLAHIRNTHYVLHIFLSLSVFSPISAVLWVPSSAERELTGDYFSRCLVTFDGEPIFDCSYTLKIPGAFIGILSSSKDLHLLLFETTVIPLKCPWQLSYLTLAPNNISILVQMKLHLIFASLNLWKRW